MPRVAKALSPLEIKRLVDPGAYAVGHVAGLTLNVKPTGARSWILRTTISGKRTEIGLGGYPSVMLAQATERARETLDQVRRGTNPVAERRELRTVAEWTFKRCAEAYIAGHRAKWKNKKHASQWENTLETYAYPVFGSKHVRDVTRPDVLRVIEPHWSTKNETMTRVRNRIELILSWAMQKEYRPEGLNPARWRDNLDAALPKPSKVAKREHFEAMPVAEAGAFMKQLRAAEGTGARALEFVVLTASRSGAVRMARWNEIDLDARVWTCPGKHMKSSRPHRVPLAEPAIRLLQSLPKGKGADLIFPGAREGKPLSDMALTAVMRRMKLTAVPHGFRSTFSDWCAEMTNTPAEVREMALAHAIGDATEEAYRRGDLFEKRREVMSAWAEFLSKPMTAGPEGPAK